MMPRGLTIALQLSTRLPTPRLADYESADLAGAAGWLPLVGLVMIMDSRHPLTDLDVQMIDWFAQTGKPIHVLLSKADKLTRQEQALVLREVQAELKGIGDNCTVQLFSSLKRTGVAEAEAMLAGWLDMEILEEVAPPVGLRTEKVARAKNRKAIGWCARTAAKALQK